MKYDLKISRLAIVCALFATTAGGAFGAASVRSLGGAGTYSGTAAASGASASTGTASTSGTAAARAGSLRVSGGTAARTTATGSTAKTSSANRAATTPRLSVGKYLGGGTSSTGSSLRNQTVSSGSGTGGSNVNPDVLDKLDDRVDELEKWRQALRGDDYIHVDDNDITLDVDALKDALGQDITFDVDDNGIQWSYDNGAGGGTVVTWDELRERLNTGDDIDGAIDSALSSVKSDLEDIKTRLTNVENGKQDKLSGSTYISIEGNTISAVGLQPELKEGSNITIDKDTNTISADLDGLLDGDALEKALEEKGYVEGPDGDGLFILQKTGGGHEWLEIDIVGEDGTSIMGD